MRALDVDLKEYYETVFSPGTDKPPFSELQPRDKKYFEDSQHFAFWRAKYYLKQAVREFLQTLKLIR